MLIRLILAKKIYISKGRMNDDQYYMALAIKEAEKASQIGEVPVGAVIVDEHKRVIGTGFNQPITSVDSTSHAEIIAMRAASKFLDNYRLVNTSLYVTIEPCIMCMGAIIHARIKRVFFGAADKKWGAARSLYRIGEDERLNHQVEIIPGIMEEESRKLIQDFFKDKRS
jgi:tRNA(adenine34) deaminase